MFQIQVKETASGRWVDLRDPVTRAQHAIRIVQETALIRQVAAVRVIDANDPAGPVVYLDMAALPKVTA